jgi:Transcriptional regulator containing PAS, AAA-type ATPase, and DNA-binding domains
MRIGRGSKKNTASTITVEALLGASYDGIAVFDAAGDVFHFGGGLDEKLDQQCWKDMQQICQKVIQSGKTISIQLQGEDCFRFFLLTANPVRDEHGKTTHVVCNIRDTEELAALERDVSYSAIKGNNKPSLTEGLGDQKELKKFITRSVAMQSVLATAWRVAQVNSTILILGESGVGKGLLARLIQKISKRKNEPFVKISCGAIPEALLESELFGYEAGAFTGARKTGKLGLFEAAGNGTVFLDEVAELPLGLQVKLLNVLQDRTFVRVGGIQEIVTNARVIAATNKSLEEQVKNGQFRSDLYYRLHVIPIVIPPLRERKGDILPLTSHFIENFNKCHGFRKTLSPGVIDCFVKYDWPGNVRELQNVIEYLVVVAQEDVIMVHDLPKNILESAQCKGAIVNGDSAGTTLKDALEDYERELIFSVLMKHETLKDAADSLGIDISTLTRKKQKYGLIKNKLIQDDRMSS